MYEFKWLDSNGKEQRKLMVICCDKETIGLCLADYRIRCKRIGVDQTIEVWQKYLEDEGINAYILPDVIDSFDFSPLE